LHGKDLIAKGLEKGLFERRPDGAVEIDLSAHKLGRKVVLRSDGTSVYMTQDIGTTVQKAEEEGLDGQVWVVAEEQKHHFRVLFKIMEVMGYDWASDLHHLAYGLVHLPEGRMKSREGKVVDADDLMDEVRDLAAQEIRARDTDDRIEPEEVDRRAEVIGLAALRFMLLKVTPLASMTFNPKESVKFEGDTGARVLYAYARLNTMIQDAGADAQGRDASFELLGHPTERELALRLLEYPHITAKAAADLNPAAITTFLLDVARELNRFYERCDILREKDTDLRRARLLLCRGAAQTIAHACGLLGIPLLERM
jgi:arginyl-tRNA synthetase